MFRQVDIELNQRLITASVGSYYPYKVYLDAVLSSNIEDTKGILKNELFHKDFYDVMDSDLTSNIGFDQRYKPTNKGNTVFLDLSTEDIYPQGYSDLDVTLPARRFFLTHGQERL